MRLWNAPSIAKNGLIYIKNPQMKRDLLLKQRKSLGGASFNILHHYNHSTATTTAHPRVHNVVENGTESVGEPKIDVVGISRR